MRCNELRGDHDDTSIEKAMPRRRGFTGNRFTGEPLYGGNYAPSVGGERNDWFRFANLPGSARYG